MKTLIAEDGTVLTDELIEQMADDAEAGFPGATITPVQGQPWLKRAPMVTRSVRVPEALWDAVEKTASENGQSASEWAREAISARLYNQHAVA